MKKLYSIFLILFFFQFLSFAREWPFSDFVPDSQDKAVLDEMSQLCENGDYEKAGEVFKKYQKTHPESPYMKSMKIFLKSEDISESSDNDALKLYNSRKYKASLKTASEILEKNPKDYEALVLRAAALSALEPEKAIKECDKILYFVPQNPSILVIRGIAYISMNEYEKAIKSYSLAILLSPDSFKYNCRGVAYYLDGKYKDKSKYEKAIADFSESIRLSPNGLNTAYADRALAYYDILVIFSDKIEGEMLEKFIVDSETYINAGGKELNTFVILADIYKRLKKYEKALQVSNKYISLFPDSPYGYNIRGDIYREMKNYDNAFADFNKSLEISQKSIKAYVGLGQIYSSLGKTEKAIDNYTSAIKYGTEDLDKGIGNPEEVRNWLGTSYRRRGLQYRKAKNYDNALADFEMALKIFTIDSRKVLVQKYIDETKKLAATKKESKKNVKSTELVWPFISFEAPVGDRTVLDDVRAKMDAGKYEKAKKLFDRYFIEGNCLSEEYASELKDFIGSQAAHTAIENEVVNLYKAGKFLPSSVMRPKRYLKKAPENYRNIILLATALSRRDPEKAIQECNNLLYYYPMNPLVYLIRGQAYNKMGNKEKALNDYSASLFLKGNAYVYSLRGDINQYTYGKYEDAIKDYTESIRLSPKDLNSAYADRSNAYYWLGEYDKAIADAERFVAAGGKQYEAFNTLMRIYSERKEYEVALKYSEKYIEISPKSKLGYNMKGRVYSKMGHYEKASEEYTKSLKQDSKYVTAYENRCYAYQKIGEFKKALADAEKAIKYAKKKNSKYSIYTSYQTRGLVYIEMKKQKEALSDFKTAMSFATDSQKNALQKNIENACSLSPDYERVSLEVKNGRVIIPVSVGNKNYKLNFIFDSFGENGYLFEKGIDKVSEYMGKDIYDWKMQEQIKNNPEKTTQEIEEELQKTKDGSFSLFEGGIAVGDQKVGKTSFFVTQAKGDDVDGIISIGAFKEAKSITIDYKNKFFEVNSPFHQGKGIPMYKLSTERVYCYYIKAELDGVVQPFTINVLGMFNIVRKNMKESKIYEGKELDKIIAFANSNDAVSTGISRTANLKIGDLNAKLIFYPYTKWLFENAAPQNYAFFSVYNSLGYPFFKDKCVQFDFENMMLYVW